MGKSPNAAFYNGTLIVWRKNTRADLSRPTTVAEVLGTGMATGGYAGAKEREPKSFQNDFGSH